VTVTKPSASDSNSAVGVAGAYLIAQLGSLQRTQIRNQVRSPIAIQIGGYVRASAVDSSHRK
jgi:hypothetical protein